jgi:hypothetical protein
MSMDEVIDNVVASCDGNLRGAVMALLLVNERSGKRAGVLPRDGRASSAKSAAGRNRPLTGSVDWLLLFG